MTTRCESLSLFEAGELPPEEAEAFREHLLGCEKCQAGLEELALFAGRVEDARALWDKEYRVRRIDPPRRTPVKMIAISFLAVSAAAAAAGWAVIPKVLEARRQNQISADEREIAEVGKTRPIEPRLTSPLADEWHPYSTHLGAASDADDPLGAMDRLQKAGHFQAVASGYLLRGDKKRAARYLDKAAPPGASADVDSDRAALLIVQGDPKAALAVLDGVLKTSPGHRQALWNKALALRDLDLDLAAAQAFEEAAARGEPGWREEAASRAKALKEPLERNKKDWYEALAAGNRMASEGGVAPVETARRFPGLTRYYLYESVRSAQSRDRVLALTPIAAELDRPTGKDVLLSYVKRVAEADFVVRGRAAARYAALMARSTPPPVTESESLIAEIRRAGQPDILLGALAKTQLARTHLDEFRALAAATADPWLAAIASLEEARAQIAEGRSLDGEATLTSAIAACRQARIEYRCFELQSELILLHTKLYRPVEAEKQAQAAWAEARQEHDWGHEVRLLHSRGLIPYFQSNLPLARAYFQEALLREPDNCTIQRYVHTNAASMDIMAADPAAARLEIDAAPLCGEPIQITAAFVLADLARSQGKPEDADKVFAGLGALRERLTPGERLLADQIEGRMLLEHKADEGRAKLKATITAADQMPRSDPDAPLARKYSYAALVMDAARTGQLGDALGLMASEVGSAPPARCALGAAVEDERSAVVVRGADGVVRGRYQPRRDKPGPFSEADRKRFIPGDLLASVAGCESVAVYARPPLQGAPDLLPVDLAWSYRVGAPIEKHAPPGAAAIGRRVIVTDVDPPRGLDLPPVGSWEVDAMGPAVEDLKLTHLDATPARVLQAIEDATEIEFHAHGLVDLGISDVSHLVLTPDGAGAYALTAGEVRRHPLRRAPFVLLASCRAGEMAPYLYESWSLPIAFIEAGASAVLASPVTVDEERARTFFSDVRRRIHGGQLPATALRDARIEALRTNPDHWAGRVLLFERSAAL